MTGTCMYNPLPQTFMSCPQPTQGMKQIESDAILSTYVRTDVKILTEIVTLITFLLYKCMIRLSPDPYASRLGQLR